MLGSAWDSATSSILNAGKAVNGVSNVIVTAGATAGDAIKNIGTSTGEALASVKDSIFKLVGL